MQYEAHRGVSTEFPENTMAAFLAAVKQGYDMIELDLGVTKDLQIVALHDDTVNRTGRTKDGAKLAREVMLSSCTYDTLQQFDVGRHFSNKFCGTEIPLFSDVLHMAEQHGIALKIDNKFQRFTTEEKEALYALVEASTAKAEFTVSDLDHALEIKTRFPNANIHYDGTVCEETLKALCAACGKDGVTVWIPIKAPHTDWVTVERANPVLCAMVKQYAKLGLWLLTEYDQLEQAKSFGADIIETAGSIKPPQNIGVIADMHTHSEHSPDADCPFAEMAAAQNRGETTVMALTDHCNIADYKEEQVLTLIRNSVQDAKKANAEYQGALKVLCGLEIGEAVWYPNYTKEVLEDEAYDVVIGSVHGLRNMDYYSQIDFSTWEEQALYDFMEQYFDDLETMLQTVPVDIAAHLTCPVRYICGKYGRNMNVHRFDDKIKQILSFLIAHGIALEVNTSGIYQYGFYMPDLEIIKMYRKMGGYLITTGSDAHVPQNASLGLQELYHTLYEIGFRDIFYFEKRAPVPCRLKNNRSYQ